MSDPAGGTRTPDTAEARLLRVVLDRLPALIAYWDRDCRNVVANDPYVEWFGVEPERMRGIHIREVLGEQVYALNLPYIEGVLGGEEQLFQRTLVDTLGRTRHTQASYVPDVVDGEVLGFFVLVTDVTPRVETERALDEAQRIASLGSWSLDVATGDLELSAESRRISGLGEHTQVTREDIFAMLHPDDVSRARAVQAEAVSTGVGYEMDYRIVRRDDGEVRELHSRAQPQLAPDGSVVRLNGIVQDVTEARERAREIDRVNAELVRSNEVKSDVIGMLGHDIRQPLQLVVGYLQEVLAGEVGSAGGTNARYLDRALSAALRMNMMIEDILTMARLDASTSGDGPPATAVREIVQDAVREVSSRATFSLEVDGDPVALVDPAHLRHAVANLIENAKRYGEPPLTVSVSTTGDRVTIRVSDQGEGVPADFVPHLFDRFARASSGVALRVPGSGFGLYIVKRLVEANGGTITYSDNVPRGACFTVSLPAAP
jgi:PAS domain S-box-containing protein